MKKLLTILVVLAVGYSSVSAKEIDPKTPVGMAVMKSGSVFKLFYKGVKQTDVKVTILNEQGKPVFKETIRDIESFMRPYNFSELEEGEYTIELNSDEGRQLQKINYNKGEKLIRLLPVTGERKKYVLSVPNQGAELLQVKIYDNNDTLLYNETESFEGNFAKVYNLASIKGGFYFVVTNKDGLTQSFAY